MREERRGLTRGTLRIEEIRHVRNPLTRENSLPVEVE
jgi:hypothetical protein